MSDSDDGKLLAAIHAEDDLHVVIRGHQLVEEELNTAIEEALPEPHAIEIAKLSFALKIDLAVALQAVRLDSRPTFAAINRLRNRFAHRSDAALSAQDTLDIRNLLSPWQRHCLGDQLRDADTPRDTVRLAIAIAFIEADRASAHFRQRKLESEVMHEMVLETLAGKRQGRGRISVEEDLRERVSKRLEPERKTDVPKK